MKITVIGTGYVGLVTCVTPAQVVALHIAGSRSAMSTWLTSDTGCQVSGADLRARAVCPGLSMGALFGPASTCIKSSLLPRWLALELRFDIDLDRLGPGCGIDAAPAPVSRGRVCRARRRDRASRRRSTPLSPRRRRQPTAPTARSRRG